MEKVPWEVSHLVHHMHKKTTNNQKKRQTVQERERERLNSVVVSCYACHGRQANTFDVISFHEVVKTLDLKQSSTT
jgi:cytochrome c553